LPHQTQRLYRIESMHPPGYPMTAVVSGQP